MGKKYPTDRGDPTYVPQRGDRVRYVFDDDDTWGEGVIVSEGPTASVWRPDSDRADRVRSNRDFRLVERPDGPRPTTAARAAPRAKLEASGYQTEARLSRAKSGNPKREGSSAHPRWALMLEHADRGDTVGKFLAAGGNPQTLKNGVAKGYVKVS